MATEINIQVEYCSLCPLSNVIGPYWNPDYEEDDYSVYCTKLKKYVYEDLHWTECAARNSKHDGVDRVGEFCPFKTIC